MFDPNKITVFSETNFRNQRRKFGIKAIDRSRHMYLIGKTGMGKSTTLEHLIMADIKEGNGVAVIDPHGDLVEKIIDYVPTARINDVVYFNPADVDHPIAFNALENVDPVHQHLVASGLVGVFKKMFAESWGPRLEYLLRNAVLALLDYPGSTLLGVQRILTDKAFRKKVIKKIKDPIVKSFWVDEYSKYPDRFQTEAIAPIQNKVGQFLSISLIRNIIAQVKSSIDMKDIMDNRKILLFNLAKGRIGEDASGLFGAMMITKIQLAAMERIERPEAERVPFYLYVDEFQNFATESFATILSEARKYALNLIVAHQYIEQLEEEVQAAIFGNVGSILVFRIGAADAEVLIKEFEPYFTEEDLVNLSKYDIYLKLMIDGVSSKPFSASTLFPLKQEDKTNNAEKIIKVSRERYSTDRAIIEDKVMRWIGVEDEEEPPKRRSASSDGKSFRKNDRPQTNNRDKFKKESARPFVSSSKSSPQPQSTKSAQPPKPAPRVQPKQNEPKPKVEETVSSPKVTEDAKIENKVPAPSTPAPEKKPEPKAEAKPAGDLEKLDPKSYPFEVKCDECGSITRVSFKPDGSKPVYCKPCLSKVRRERSKKISEQKNIVRSVPAPAKPASTNPKINSSEPQKMSPGQAVKLNN